MCEGGLCAREEMSHGLHWPLRFARAYLGPIWSLGCTGLFDEELHVSDAVHSCSPTRPSQIQGLRTLQLLFVSVSFHGPTRFIPDLKRDRHTP